MRLMVPQEIGLAVPVEVGHLGGSATGSLGRTSAVSGVSQPGGDRGAVEDSHA